MRACASQGHEFMNGTKNQSLIKNINRTEFYIIRTRCHATNKQCKILRKYQGTYISLLGTIS